ncbi:MAG: pseudouridine synthase [Patescibacteria group bacterium]|jgi:23S rRNA pseudouridine2604 synthase
MNGTRINKYIAQFGSCSRRKADALIEEGDVMINGKKAKLGDAVFPGDQVMVQGKKLRAETKRIYVAFHKPVGVISTADPHARRTIFDYVKLPERTFSIGRLDVASSGLMILTNDGALAEALSHARGSHEKEYRVVINKPLTPETLQTLERGVVILGKKTKPCKTKKLSSNTFLMTLTEGRNRQIRRMCEKLGYGVTALQRIRIATLHLGNLPVGTWRPLTQKELDDLLRIL